jgi:hypothetical protein
MHELAGCRLDGTVVLDCQAREPESVFPDQFATLVLALVDLTTAAGKHHDKFTAPHQFRCNVSGALDDAHSRHRVASPRNLEVGVVAKGSDHAPPLPQPGSQQGCVHQAEQVWLPTNNARSVGTFSMP